MAVEEGKIKRKPFEGISLVEVSIILLLTAGLVAGAIAAKSIMSNSEMNTLIAEMNNIRRAHRAFVEVYQYMPGDLPNAENFFGLDCSKAEGGCNGNGDGQISDAIQEMRNSTWHLNFSGLYDSKLNSQKVKGLTVPGLEHRAFRFGMIAPNLEQLYGHIANNGVSYLKITAEDGTAALSSVQAHYIDSKIDDGNAFQGKIVATNNWGMSDSCVNASSASISINGKEYFSASSGDYNLNEKGATCRMYYSME
jgi:hypothetical protein